MSDAADNVSPQKRDRSCNLVLVAHPGVAEPSDFRRIADWIARERPAVQTHVLVDGRYLLRRLLLARRATIVFSPIRLRRFRPLRGRVFAGRALSKGEEYDALAAAGVPAPRT